MVNKQTEKIITLQHVFKFIIDMAENFIASYFKLKAKSDYYFKLLL